MKRAIVLLSAALAAAHVTQKGVAPDQALFAGDGEAKNGLLSTTQGWWDNAIRGESLLFLQGKLANGIARVMSDAAAHIALAPQAEDEDDDDSDDGHHHGGHGRHGRHGRHGHHGNATKTIYELIQESKYTKRFAAIVDEHDDIKAILQDTKANHTIFVPTDRAFERLPEHGKPPAEAIRAALAYSIAPGRWPARRLFFSQTVPTELELDDLGGHRQRLHIDASLIFGLHVNFYSKVVAADIVAKNGLIHAVDSILVPPPPQDKILQLFPTVFSTFSLALETTGLADDLADLAPWHGGTVFAPTNRAFARLGPRANAFLFSDRGKKFLKALLKYSIVANETLYSDAYYKRSSSDGAGGEDAVTKIAESRNYWHVDLPSLLDDKPISVDIKHWKGFVSIVVNGYTRVAAPNIVAEDGVLHIVNNVLIPPRRNGHHGSEQEVDDEDREVSVEELVERLEPYVVGSPAGDSEMGDL